MIQREMQLLPDPLNTKPSMLSLVSWMWHFTPLQCLFLIWLIKSCRGQAQIPVPAGDPGRAGVQLV